MAKLNGALGHLSRLRRLTSPEAKELVTQALFVGAQRIQQHAQISITNGAVSGANHVASAPGTPPNNDTGVLANNIEAAIVGPLHAQVSSNAPYAAIQEFGGTIAHPGGTAFFIGQNGLAVFVSDESPYANRLPRTKPHNITLPERPYMRPAAEQNRKEVTVLVQKAINAAIRRFGGTSAK